jgi:O-antigen ligase
MKQPQDWGTERMHFLERISAVRSSLVTPAWVYSFFLLFCLFLSSLFLTDNVRLHRNLYYFLVIAPFLMVVQADFFRLILKSTVFQMALAYLVYLWLTLFWSSQTSLYIFYNEARTLLIMLSFLAITAYYALHIQSFSSTLSRCLACVVGVASIISLTLFYSDRHFSMMGGLESRAVDIGLAAHPIDSAGLYGFVAVFLIFALFVHARWKSIWTWLCGASLLAILLFVGLTQTRGAILGVVLVLVLGLVFQGGKRLWLIMGILTAVTLGVVLLSINHPEGMIGFERRFSVREEIWLLALERAWERPWFGFGLNEHQQLFLASGEYHGVAHNLYLENLHFGGLVGTMLLMTLIGVALSRAWREYRGSGSFLLPAVFLYPLVVGVSAGYLTLAKISPMWIQFWLPIGLIIGAEIRWRQTRGGADIPALKSTDHG